MAIKEMNQCFICGKKRPSGRITCDRPKCLHAYAKIQCGELLNECGFENKEEVRFIFEHPPKTEDELLRRLLSAVKQVCACNASTEDKCLACQVWAIVNPKKEVKYAV